MSADAIQDFQLSRLSGALQQTLLQVEAVHAFQIERQADETPFTGCRSQAAQGELAKASKRLECGKCTRRSLAHRTAIFPTADQSQMDVCEFGMI